MDRSLGEVYGRPEEEAALGVGEVSETRSLRQSQPCTHSEKASWRRDCRAG